MVKRDRAYKLLLQNGVSGSEADSDAECWTGTLQPFALQNLPFRIVPQPWAFWRRCLSR